MTLSKISKKGQLTLPVRIRRKYNIGKSSYIRIIELEDGIKLVPVGQGGIASLKGAVKVDEMCIRDSVKEGHPFHIPIAS